MLLNGGVEQQMRPKWWQYFHLTITYSHFNHSHFNNFICLNNLRVEWWKDQNSQAAERIHQSIILFHIQSFSKGLRVQDVPEVSIFVFCHVFFSHLPNELHSDGFWQAVPTARNMGRTLSFTPCLQTPGYRVWHCHCSRHEGQSNQSRGFDVTLTQIGGSEQAGKISQHSASVQPT